MRNTPGLSNSIAWYFHIYDMYEIYDGHGTPLPIFGLVGFDTLKFGMDGTAAIQPHRNRMPNWGEYVGTSIDRVAAQSYLRFIMTSAFICAVPGSQAWKQWDSRCKRLAM